jgi:nicotinamide-nucleotide amidase
MKAVIITIGDELLIGQTVDTNSAWIGSEMSKIGFDITKKISIHDKREDILDLLGEIAGKVDVALITGGLGPTSDDITKPTLCEFFGTTLELNPEVLEMVVRMMSSRNYPLTELNKKQAEVPKSCQVIKNAAGTAPGMWFEKDNTIFVSMPGVPMEMEYLMTSYVLPKLKTIFNNNTIIHKNLMLYGIPESLLAERLTNFESNLPKELKLAYLPSAGVIKLRLTGSGSNNRYIENLINEKVGELYSIIPQYIFAEDEETMEITIGKLLISKNKTIATAESCTGGNISTLITSVPGSSQYFMGSIVAYDNSIKTCLLGVKDNLLSEFGAVSEQVVEAMAIGARRELKTDYAIATSGIAGPSGGSEYKPVGTVWISVSSEKRTISQKLKLGTDRKTNITRASLAAINLAMKEIML